MDTDTTHHLRIQGGTHGLETVGFHCELEFQVGDGRAEFLDLTVLVLHRFIEDMRKSVKYTSTNEKTIISWRSFAVVFKFSPPPFTAVAAD